MLQAVGLECVRGRRRLFHDLCFEAEAGELIWVAGPNGSGKTSLLRILCTLLSPDAGSVHWRGSRVHDLGEAFLAELLYLGHAAGVKDDLSALENLRFSLAQHGTRADGAALIAALASFGLRGREALPARALSQGQRRRVALARLAFAAAQTLWILDEPLTALDSDAVGLVRDRIGEHLGRGGVVVLTSHQDLELGELRMRRLPLGE
jgi:heme exporter protein A